MSTQKTDMTFEEWWASEERDRDWYLPLIAEAAWNAATAAERERCAKVCEQQLDEPASTNWNLAVKCSAAAIRARA
jgi:hypothetical protein